MKHKIHWCGKICYQKSLKKQYYLANLTEEHFHILGAEYDPVITIGIRGNEDDIPNSLNDIPIFHIKRGGQTTIHNPGQVVIYPIVSIKKLKLKIRQFIDLIINCTIQTFEKFDCQVNFSEDKKGFYARKGKIAFLGLQFKRGISMHGISINVSNNLELLKKIKSCGIVNEKFDKMANHHNEITPKAFFDKWTEQFVTRL